MRGPYKKQSFEILKARGIEINTILDVGILDGTPELIEAFPDRKHVLFEPVVEFASKIEEVYRRIDHELHAVAVSDRSGEVTLQVRTILSTRAISHSGMVADGAVKEGAQYRKVPMVSLDDFMAEREFKPPFLLKIDIDGHELAVLRGAQKVLKDTAVVIVETPKSQLPERIVAVQNAGFEIFDLVETCYYDESFWQCDAVFIRRDLQRKYFKQLGSDFDGKLYQSFR